MTETPNSHSLRATTPLVIGVTSHRNIPAREAGPVRARVRELLGQLQNDFPHSPLTIVSPLAEGGDQWVAEEGLALGARLIAPLPLPRELYVQDFVEPDVRERFDVLCAHAHVIELPLLPGHRREDIAVHGPARDRQYAQVGMFVARHCHLLLAIWDGKSPGRTGGTAQIVDYFLTGALPGGMERRHGGRLRLYATGDERLLCHFVCSRDRPDGAPAAPLQPGQVIWRDPDEISQPDAPMPAKFRVIFAHADQFNVDSAAYAGQIEQAGEDIGGAATNAQAGAAAAHPSPAVLFRAADWLAVHFQKRVLLAMRVIYAVAFVMGVAFTVYGNLAMQNSLLYLFLLLFAVGVLVTGIAKRRGWHRKYLDYRALAEGLRVQCYWRRAGVPFTGDAELSQDSPMQKQDIELRWVRNVLRGTGLASASRDTQAGTDALRAVIDEWVGDATRGELGYYLHRTGQREHAQRVNEAIGAISLLVGVAISVALVILAGRLSTDAKNELMVVMAAFSIFAAVREAYSFRKADRELIRQYHFMERVFSSARRALDKAENADEQRDILRALGEAALAEHAEWAVMHRQRPLEAGKM